MQRCGLGDRVHAVLDATKQLDAVDTKMTTDAAVKECNQCGYVKSAYLADRFGNVPLDP